jgi:carboxypeptidase PM20D1
MFTYIGPELSFPYNVLFTNNQVTEGLLKMQLSGKNTTNAMMRTTIAPTIIQAGVKDNVLPTEARAAINFRILPGETVASVKDHVIKAINDGRVKVTVLNPDAAQNPSKVSDIESYGFKTIQKTTQQIFPNVVVSPFLVIGATDGRHYQHVCNQIFRFLPLQIQSSDLSRIHGIDERVSKENYLRAIRFYVQLIKNSGTSE